MCLISWCPFYIQMYIAGGKNAVVTIFKKIDNFILDLQNDLQKSI